MNAPLGIKTPAKLWLTVLIGATIGPLSPRSALANDSGASINIGASVNIHEHVETIEPPAEVVRRVTVVSPAYELYCTGGLRYQVGSGGWCTHARGTARIDLPLHVRVAEAPCRLTLPDIGTFEVAAHSRFSINRIADQRFTLVVESGSVRYSVVEDAFLRVSSPYEGIGAWCVGGVHGTAPARRCTGRVVVDAEEGFQVYNLDGHVAYERGGRTIREVGSRSGLHVRLAAGVGMRAAADLPMERALLLEDYSDDIGWREVEVHRKGHAVGRARGAVREDLRIETSEDDHETYEQHGKGRAVGREKGKFQENLKVATWDDEDTHEHQQGKGHQEHGNGKGLGHTKLKENKGHGHGHGK